MLNRHLKFPTVPRARPLRRANPPWAFLQPQQPMKNKTKSKKQVGYLLSKGSPLSQAQQSKLKKELHSGKVKVRKK